MTVALHVQRAVGLAQAGNGRVLLQLTRQARIGAAEVGIGCGVAQHMLTHQPLQRGIAGLRRIQQLGVQAGLAGAGIVHLALVCSVPLGLLDGVAANLGDRIAARIEAAKAIDTDQHKGRNDQQEHEEHHDLRVLANEIEHARISLSKLKRRTNLFAFAYGGGE